MHDLNQLLRIGFTGTRKGMTDIQEAAIVECIQEMLGERGLEKLEAHHGDALGADTQFHSICRGLGIAVVMLGVGLVNRSQKQR